MSEIHILLVDDHALVREALGSKLEGEADLAVIGHAGTAEEGMRLASELHPDVVLMDIDMPGMSCFDAAKTIIENNGTRVVFLSAFFHDRYIEQALSVRAHGYLTKSEPPDRVMAAVREVAVGGSFFSDEVRDRIVVDAGSVRLGSAGHTRCSLLTPRELEVLRYIARGLSKKEIARMMEISVKTVENHSGSLMKKLNIHDRVELTRFAIREGLAEA